MKRYLFTKFTGCPYWSFMILSKSHKKDVGVSHYYNTFIKLYKSAVFSEKFIVMKSGICPQSPNVTSGPLLFPFLKKFYLLVLSITSVVESILDKIQQTLRKDSGLSDLACWWLTWVEPYPLDHVISRPRGHVMVEKAHIYTSKTLMVVTLGIVGT